jgi:hypothetical protein
MPEKIVPFDRDRALIERLEKLMAGPPEGSVVLDFTPGVAKYIIGEWRGTHNRREKPGSIRRFTADMAAEHWMLNGATVVFTDQHLLGDGQNRLLACIRSGKPFRSHVIFGVPHECFFTMDQGRVRSSSDILHIEGVENSGVVAQAVRWAELLETQRVIYRTVFTPPQILQLYRDKHSGVEDFLPEARAVFRLNRQPVSIVAALLYSFTKKDPELAAEYANAWASGIYDPRFASIATMQSEIERIHRKASGRVHEVVRIAMIINSWNMVRAGYKGSRGASIRWSPPEKGRPAIFPPIR